MGHTLDHSGVRVECAIEDTVLDLGSCNLAWLSDTTKRDLGDFIVCCQRLGKFSVIGL